jgi:S1-C subfamily serine protease
VGLGKGDTVLSLNGTPIAQPGDWERVLSTLTPGTEIELVFESRSEKKTARVVVEKNDRLEIVPMTTRTPQQEALRLAWLSSRAK